MLLGRQHADGAGGPALPVSRLTTIPGLFFLNRRIHSGSTLARVQLEGSVHGNVHLDGQRKIEHFASALSPSRSVVTWLNFKRRKLK